MNTRNEIGFTQFRFPVSDILFLIVVLLFLLDAATTAYGLSVGFHESNPIMVSIINNFKFTGFILVMVLGLTLICLVAEGLELFWRTKTKIKNPWIVSAGIYSIVILVESFIVMQNLNQLL